MLLVTIKNPQVDINLTNYEGYIYTFTFANKQILERGIKFYENNSFR